MLTLLCSFTGGYLESRLQLPGNETVSGFW